MKRKLKLERNSCLIPVFRSRNKKLSLCAGFVRRMGIGKDRTECTVEVRKQQWEGARQISIMDYYMDGYTLKWRFSKARDDRNKPILGWKPIFGETAQLLRKYFYCPEQDGAMKINAVRIWVKIY